MKKLFFLISIYVLSMALSAEMAAQDAATPAAGQSSELLDLAYHNIFLILAVIVLIGVILAGLNLIWALIDVQRMKLLEQFGSETMEKAKLGPSVSLWDKISQKSWKLVPLEKEADIDLGHEYDGIRELDNSLPPWWLWLFYITITWSVGYLWYYHVSDKGPGSAQEYIAAMEKGEADKAAYLVSQTNLVDEKTVTVLTGEADIAEGKEIYTANCLVCHGAAGEGGVGPNFTDKYWIHGGSINNIFSTIKYGVAEKGMISWKEQLRPGAMQKVASYILTFQGTNPPNQKEPQGVLYEPPADNSSGTEPAADTTSTLNPAGNQ
jgi:cytochrome c oxidase cbb3-type subunit 3